jgi:protein SCO1/2
MGRGRSGLQPWRPALISIWAAAVVAALAGGCGAGGATSPAEQARPGDASAPNAAPPGSLTAARFAGTQAKPRKPAPPLALGDSFGRPVDLQRFRGKAVIVTFVYVNCPDVCPLILDNLRIAQSELGAAAEDLRILAVSVDPEGDTAMAVNAFLKAHRITRRIRYLIGSRRELERVWSDWSIVSKRSPRRNDPDFVEHSAMVYGIDARGRITTLYPTSFDPRQIAHDVPILASE